MSFTSQPQKLNSIICTMMIMLQESPFSRKGSKGSVIARWEERRVGREGGKKKKPLEWERLLGSLIFGKCWLSQQPINEQIG